MANPPCFLPAPTVPPAPYATGICNLFIACAQNVKGVIHGVSSSVHPRNISPYIMQSSVKDNSGTEIGFQDLSACEATYPCRLNSKLEDRIVMQPIMPSGGQDPASLYVQIQVGNTRFSTNDSTTSGGNNVQNPSGIGCSEPSHDVLEPYVTPMILWTLD